MVRRRSAFLGAGNPISSSIALRTIREGRTWTIAVRRGSCKSLSLLNSVFFLENKGNSALNFRSKTCKGKIVSALFHTFPHSFPRFPPGLALKIKPFLKRIKENKREEKEKTSNHFAR